VSGKQLTLIAHLEDILRAPAAAPPEYLVRAATADDEDTLAILYLTTYPAEIVKDLAEAREELKVTFEGQYGRLDLAASPIALSSEHAAANVLTVTKAPWRDTPRGPLIIEVMVHPQHRRKGLAGYLIRIAARGLACRGRKTAALRVMSDNHGALRLYRRLGFREWSESTR